MPELVRKAAELGLMGGGIPEEYGGSGLDKISATVLAEKLSAYASFSVTHGAHAGIGTLPIVYFGTEEQKKKYLPKLASGELIAAYCLSEPQAGSDAQNARTRAVLSPDGKHWILNGQKMWITNGGFADVDIVFAKPIGEFGLVRAKLAEMAIRTYAVESMLYRSAGMIEGAMSAAGAAADKTQQLMKVLEEYAIESSINKVYGSEVLSFVVDEAVQIYGGYGFHEDYPVARTYRDSRINRIFEGTNEINRLLIIQMLLKRALSGALPLMAAGAKLQEEILAGPQFEEAATGPFAEDERAVANAKKTFLLAAGAAVQKHREQQRLLGV